MNLFRTINDGANSLAIKAMTVTGESKPQSKKAVKAKKILTAVISASIAATMCAVTAFADGDSLPTFFTDAIDVLQTVIFLIGAGVAVWGVVNLLEGYGNDNPGAKSQGMKQLMAGIGVALIGLLLMPSLKTYIETETAK